jgi:hypothetical protein
MTPVIRRMIRVTGKNALFIRNPYLKQIITIVAGIKEKIK